MSKEEKEAMKELHYKKVKTMCQNYQDKEIVYKYSFVDGITRNIAESVFCVDIRLAEINKLINNLIKERNRIIEIEMFGEK